MTNGNLPDPEGIAKEVVNELNTIDSPYYVEEKQGKRLPCIEDVQDLVELILAKQGYQEVMTSYKVYRKKRENIRRRLRIRTRLETKRSDATDALLLVESTTQKPPLAQGPYHSGFAEGNRFGRRKCPQYSQVSRNSGLRLGEFNHKHNTHSRNG